MNSNFILRALFCAGLLFSGTVNAQSLSPSFCTTPIADDATFEALADKITQCNLKSVDDVIPLLSSAHLSNYVLVHHSQSMQDGSPDAPRAILYGKDAKLVIAFNGKAGQARNDFLEVLQFRDETNRFEAREIEFATPVRISDANPALCTACHQTDIRPNWQAYPLWPGTFGGEDDSVFRKDEPSGLKGQDWKAFNDFLSTGKTQGRYKALSALPGAPLPNTIFGSALAKLNHKRISSKIGVEPSLNPYRYALVGASACFYSNDPIESFIPVTLSAKFKKALFQMTSDTSLANRNDFLGRVNFLKQIYTKAPEQDRTKEFVLTIKGWTATTPPEVNEQISTSLRWIVENQGISTDDWGMQSPNPSYNFEYGYIGIADLKSELSKALLTASDEATWVQSLQNSEPSDLNAICDGLKAKSLQALSLISQ